MRYGNEGHTIFGAAVGAGCHNCQHLEDDTCAIRLIRHDEDEQHNNLPYMDRLRDQCTDWVTAFPQYIDHSCSKDCK